MGQIFHELFIVPLHTAIHYRTATFWLRCRGKERQILSIHWFNPQVSASGMARTGRSPIPGIPPSLMWVETQVFTVWSVSWSKAAWTGTMHLKMLRWHPKQQLPYCTTMHTSLFQCYCLLIVLHIFCVYKCKTVHIVHSPRFVTSYWSREPRCRDYRLKCVFTSVLGYFLMSNDLLHFSSYLYLWENWGTTSRSSVFSKLHLNAIISSF